MDTLWQDLRYGIRMLYKNAGATVIVLLSLALGIAGNVSIFSFVNALLLRPPAVEAPHELLEVWNQNPKAGSAFERYDLLSYPGYAYYRDHTKVFKELLAFDGDTAFLSWSRAGQGQLVQGQCVSGNFFSLLGVEAALGRTFLPEEDKTPGTHPVAVLSHAFWREQLASDRNVLGTSLTLNGQSFTVVGVAHPGFTGMTAGIAPALWVPLMMAPQILHDPEWLTREGSFSLFAIGRLQPGITASQAGAEMNLLAHQLSKSYVENRNLQAAVFPATLVPGPFRGFVAAFTGVLMAVVVLVLLIACANAANFLLAQTTQRRREMAIRSALGASRRRVIQQTLTESVLLAVLGGAAGMVLALWANPLLLSLKPHNVPVRLDVPLDIRVMGFTVLLSLLTGTVFGIVPALRSTRVDLAPTLKDEGRGGGYRRSRFRNGLVISQVALCFVLLVGGGLCLRSLFNAQSIDPGFELQNRVSARLDLKSLDYSQARGKQFYDAWVERVSALPGVESASVANYLPLETVSRGIEINIEGTLPPQGRDGFDVNVMEVGPDYFKTMGTSLQRGREFSRQDNETAPRVAIINEAMARRFWPGQDPIGRRLVEGTLAKGESYEVVGIVETGKYGTLGESPKPFLFRCFLQNYQAKATLVARTNADTTQLLKSIREEVQRLDPNLALIQLGTLRQHLSFALFPAQVTGLLLGVFGFLGLVLAIVGLSGVIAYSVSQRTHEIGIRMALGAQKQDVLRIIVGQGIVLSLIGTGIGLVVALFMTRFLTSLLYQIQPTDPITFAAVTLLMSMVSLLACYIPARRATQVDPIVALRYE